MEFQKINFNTHYNPVAMAQQQMMGNRTTVGFVVEVASTEMRVAMTPNAVRELTKVGQTVYFQTGAGMTAGFTDEMYMQAGATMTQTAQEVYQLAQILMKVQQPTLQECQLVQPQQTIFCFMTETDSHHHEQTSQILQALSQRQATVIFYEWMQTEDKTAPVMNAVSEVAGDAAVQQGMRMMETKYGGKGQLLGQVAGEEGARVLILGSGVAATRAAKMASAIGAQVTVMDVNTEKLRKLREQVRTPVQTMTYSVENLEKLLPETQLLIGAVIPVFNTENNQNTTSHTTLAQLFSWNTKPLINSTQMMSLKKSAVVVDLAKSYGGNFEKDTRAIQITEDVITNGIYTTYTPSNITSTVPNTASKAISNAVLPYVKKVATLGWKLASVEEFTVRKGLMMADGQITRMPISYRKELHPQTDSYVKVFPTQMPYTFENQQNTFQQEKAMKQLLSMMSNNQSQNNCNNFTIEA